MKEFKMLIGGKRVASQDIREILSPYDGKPVARVHFAGREHLRAAIDATCEAFEQARRMPAYKRAEILKGIAEGIGERSEELARAMAQEVGKTIKEARGEVNRATTTFTFASEEAKRISGELVPIDNTPAGEGRFALAKRFPLGPILGISPFNFPVNLVAHKVAPAIGTGNTITIKPASQTPVTALLMAEIAMDAGAVPGSFNVVPCPGPLAEEVLVSAPEFKKVSFTGSAEVGWKLKEKCGKKRITLELGGNAGAIIDDTADLEWAATRCTTGAFSCAGQICISLQRIFVAKSVYDTFMEKFLPKVKALKLGDPLDENTDVGPMITRKDAERAMEWIQEAKDAGAEILTGGKQNGSLVEPTVIVGAGHNLKVNRMEVFAPIVTVEKFTDFNKAVEFVDDSDYGLQAGVFSNDMDRVLTAFEQIEAGGVIVNDVPTFRVDPMPYGGMKDSGLGREGLKYAMEEMTELKLLVIKRR